LNWQIIIDNFLGGFAPAWYKEGYPSYGNKNQAGAMENCDLTDAGGLKQGPGLANLTNGTQAAAVTTLVRSVLDMAVTNDVTYGVGGAKLYKLTSTTVTSDATWPHAIDKGTVTGEDGEDVALFQGVLYYTYNHSGTAGDIGTYDLSSTFDDDWGSTVPTGKAALQGNVPHQMAVGGDILFIANGRYIATWNGTTFAPQQLTLPSGTVARSIVFAADKLWIAANNPDISGTNKMRASIYIWDGAAATWEAEIRMMGEIQALHVKNGVIFAFYRDVSSIGGYKLAYVNGSSVTDLANYSGGLPQYYQVTDYKDFLIWNSSSLNALWSYATYPWQLTSPWTTTTSDVIFAFGSGDKDLPVRLFQLADGGYTTVGTLSSPFGTPMVASNDGSDYRLAQFSGYTTESNWKSLAFDVTGDNRFSRINRVKINFDQLATGARVDWTIRDNQGKAIHTDTISYAKLGAATRADYPIGKIAENFRIEFDYANGDTSNTVKVKGVKIYGNTE
jgi:hypothetical protein